MITKLNSIKLHFILCTERSGSSLLSLMLNLHPQIISPSEEPFAVFFYKKYKNKTIWSEDDLKLFIEEFWLMSEKNLDLFFITKEKLFNTLQLYKNDLSYPNLVKLVYLQFIEPKDKSEVNVIVDKQIKYFFYIPLLIEIFPDAKFIVLVRDVRDNIVSKSNRKLNSSSNPIFLAALWKNTYSNINNIKQLNRPLLVVKYEELVGDTEHVLKEVCKFLSIDYNQQMIETKGKYQTFLNFKTTINSASEIERLENFQSSLFKPVTKDHIGTYNGNIEAKTLAKIEKMNSSLFVFLGYKFSSNIDVHYSFNDFYNIVRAFIYRPLILILYLYIPFSIKILIKKLRK